MNQSANKEITFDIRGAVIEVPLIKGKGFSAGGDLKSSVVKGDRSKPEKGYLIEAVKQRLGTK